MHVIKYYFTAVILFLKFRGENQITVIALPTF